MPAPRDIYASMHVYAHHSVVPGHFTLSHFFPYVLLLYTALVMVPITELVTAGASPSIPILCLLTDQQ